MNIGDSQVTAACSLVHLVNPFSIASSLPGLGFAEGSHLKLLGTQVQ